MLISFGSSVNNNKVDTTDSVWTEIVKPHQRHELNMAEFHALTADQRGDIKKSFSYFVGCGFKGGERKGNEAYGRQLLTLDADYGRPDDINYDHVLYSTFSHTPEKPKFRLLIPLNRVVNPHEYKVIANVVMKEIGLDLFDKSTSIDYCRAMFIPSCPADADPVFDTDDGFLGTVDVDAILNEVPETDYIKAMGLKDPRLKQGIIGEFCSVWDIHGVIKKFLTAVYMRSGDRYTYREGSSTKGARVYDNGLHFYSDHDTDPANDGHCKNAFDLVRVHKFDGDLEAMTSWAGELEAVRAYRDQEFIRAIEADKHIKEVSEGMRGCSKFLLEAPGILGEMVRDILPMMDRTVPEYAVAGALQSLSIVTSGAYSSYSKGAKINLMTITIGPSASGKDVPQRYVSNTATKIVGVPAWPGFTSYQEITRNLFRGNGKAIYVVDECQNLFRAGKSQEAYLSGLGDEIMKIYTAEGSVGFRGNDREALEEEWGKKLKQLEKARDPDGNIAGVNVEDIDKKIADTERKLEMIINGIDKPDLSVYGATTPTSFEQFVNDESLNNGQFGRFLWVVPEMLDSEEGIPPLNDNEELECTGAFSVSIESRLKAIVAIEENTRVVIDDEARKRSFKIKRELDSPGYRNHQYGALYRRAYHKVTKIASILGAGDGGIVMTEHVNWAYQYVQLDMSAVTRQQRESQMPDEDPKKTATDLKFAAFKGRIFDILAKNPDGLKRGILVQNTARKKKFNNRKTTENIIDELIKRGKLIENSHMIKLP